MDNTLLQLKATELSDLIDRLGEIVKRVGEGYDWELPIVTLHYHDGHNYKGKLIHVGSRGDLILSAVPSAANGSTRLYFLQYQLVTGIEIDWEQKNIERFLCSEDKSIYAPELSRNDLNQMVAKLQTELQQQFHHPVNIILDISLLKQQQKANFAGIIAEDTVKVLKDMTREEPARKVIGDSIDTILLRIDREPALNLEDRTLTVTSACDDNWFRRKSMKQMKGYLESVL